MRWSARSIIVQHSFLTMTVQEHHIELLPSPTATASLLPRLLLLLLLLDFERCDGKTGLAPSSEESKDLWHGLVVPDSTAGSASAREIESVRKLFNEDMATVHNQSVGLAEERNALPAAHVSLVIAYCSNSIEWLPFYLDGMAINDLTIYSKCNRTLAGSSYMSEIRKIAHKPLRIIELPNVGGCDHTYAYDMAHRDWASFADRKHVVLYLKDRNTQLCSKNMLVPSWNVLRPSTMIAVAAMAGFGCNLRSLGTDTLWHWTLETRKFFLKKYSRVGIHDTSGNHTEKAAPPRFGSKFRNMGRFADSMGVLLPEPLMQVCYGGNFAVSGGQFLNGTKVNDARVKVARRVERALERGNNIEEGHFMERLWAGFLQTPATFEQVASINATIKVAESEEATRLASLNKMEKKREKQDRRKTRGFKKAAMGRAVTWRTSLKPKAKPGEGYNGGTCPFSRRQTSAEANIADLRRATLHRQHVQLDRLRIRAEANIAGPSNLTTVPNRCKGHYGGDAGDAVCCGQNGTIGDKADICPAEFPQCIRYNSEHRLGTCVVPDGNTILNLYSQPHQTSSVHIVNGTVAKGGRPP